MEIGKRYVEQLQTTVETMRRRLVATYDMGVKASQRSAKLLERAREVAEPAAFDLRDHVVQACNEQEQLDANDRDTRNTLVELYLGVAVLMVGISAGQLCGVSILGALIGRVFSGWAEAALLVLLPVYVALNFRKQAGLDETERRVWLFGLALAEGALLGHLAGDRVIRVIPAVFFLQPLIFALLTDFELSPASIYADRQRLVGTAAALGGGASLVLASFPAGGFSFGVIVMSAAHVGVLFVHFQLVISAIKAKKFGASEAQLAYLTALLVAQLAVALVFGGGSGAEAEAADSQ